MSKQERFAQPLKMFIVEIATRSGPRVWMSSGFRESPRGRAYYTYTTDRSKAQRFAKYTAEEIVKKLRSDYRRIGIVHPE